MKYEDLKLIIDTVPYAVIVIDKTGRITFINHAAEMLLGLNSCEIQTRAYYASNWRMTTPEGKPFPKEKLPTALAMKHKKPAYGVECAIENPENKRVILSYNATPLLDKNGNIDHVIATLMDITERYQDKLALAIREKEYRTLVQNIPDLIVRYDTDLRRIYVNPAWEKASGLSAKEVIEKDAAKIPKVPSPIVTGYVEKINKALETGIPQRIEFTWVNAYGVTLYLEYVIVTEYDRYGKIVGVLAIGHDLTDRKHMEDALRKSESEYRRIVDTASEGIWVLSSDTLTTFVNAQMAEMLGCAPEEILGRPVTDFMFEEDAPDYLRRMENRRKGISEHFERRFRRKDGEMVWTLVSATPILDHEQRFQGAFGMYTDITEHKQFEERQKDFYRRTILAATEGKLQLTEKDEIEKIAGPPVAVFKVENAEDFRNVRVAVMDISLSLGMDEVRAGDYRMAIGEAVTNATKHANGGTVSIHALLEAMITIISDQGPGIEAMSIPEVALKKGYTTAGTLGMGYKVMTSIADKVYLATGSLGTTVGVEMNTKPPEVKLDIGAMYHALK